MTHRSRLIAALGCALSVVLLSGFSCSNEKTGQVTININDKGYDPGRVTVAMGTLVVFVNNGSQPHTATAVGAFDSGPIPPNGGRWTWTAAFPGTFQYKSLMNPDMAGQITVVVNPPTNP